MTGLQNVVKTISVCEVCASYSLVPVLNLGRQPLCDALVPIQSPRPDEKFPIEILFCNECLTCHQKYQPAPSLLFPRNYHYRSRLTKDVLHGMRDLVEKLKQQLGSLRNLTVLDIGANDGTLAGMIREAGATTIAVEPSDAVFETPPGGIFTYQEYWSGDLAQRIVDRHGPISVITMTNVFAHIDDVNGVLAAIYLALEPKGYFVMETHSLQRIVETGQFDTFYHEHPRTYSLHSVVKLAQRHGFQLLNMVSTRRYGGNLRVVLQKVASPVPWSVEIIAALEAEARLKNDIFTLQDKANSWRDCAIDCFGALTSQFGPLEAKAFPGRASVLLNWANLDCDVISGIFEKSNSPKIGHFAPGTRIPIIDEQFLFSAKRPARKPLINLAWHIDSEIRKYVMARGYTGPVLDIMNLSNSVRSK